MNEGTERGSLLRSQYRDLPTLRDDLCPVVGGRRIIPEALVEVIAMELRRKGIQVASTSDERSGVAR